MKASAPSVSGIDDFVTYFQGNWMSGAYPLSSWNVHNLSCRTNNHMEGWHSKLKKVVGKAHPNVFEIVRVFKMEQAAVDVAVAQLLAGARPPVRSRAAIEKDTKIEELKAKFTNNVISMDSFICGLSGHTNLLA